jgi:integrase
VLTLSRWAERFIESRIDVDANTTKNYRSALKKACATFGERDPAMIGADEVASWVAELAQHHKPGTVGLYLLSLRMLFDFVGLEPNPARDPRVPQAEAGPRGAHPPSAEQLLAILGTMGERWRLLFVTIEQGALRLGEAVSLRWADVDAANLRLRLPRSATKRDTARWLYLPDWLMELLEETCPLEDRVPERRVLQGSPRRAPTRR